MKAFKPKLALLILVALALAFFSNNFGLINIEKTAIITAIAIDKEDDQFSITAQIAVPEATNTTTENKKTQINAKGRTVYEAIKNTASVTGWYPQLIFCNLIILGESMLDESVITVLDYFSKTYRVQDSALVVLAKGKGEELIKSATPLDNISSFAIQKILLKNPGFDKNVYYNTVKDFCTGYYSSSKSSFMPIISPIVDDSEGNGGGGAGNEQTKNKSQKTSQENADKSTSHTVFDGTSTALFLDGKKVGELDKNLTHAFSLLTTNVNGSSFSVQDEFTPNAPVNYLLTIFSSCSKIKVKADDLGVKVSVDANLYCKISDTDGEDSNFSVSQNLPLPQTVKKSAEKKLKQEILDLFLTQRYTGCDLLKIKDKLYRFNCKYYYKHKDSYLQNMQVEVFVTVNGQL